MRRIWLPASREAYFALFLANAWDGPEAVGSLALAESEKVEIQLKMENIFGVRVPQVQPAEFDDKLPFSPVGAGASTLEAASQFRKLVEEYYKSLSKGPATGAAPGREQNPK